jgi:predicted metalloprotease with PDZ domain
MHQQNRMPGSPARSMSWARALCRSMILACCAPSWALAADGAVAYVVAPVLSEHGLAALEVTVEFAGDASGTTVLRLPDDWAGSDGLWRHLSGLEVEGATDVVVTSPAVRSIAHPPGATLTVRYRVHSAYDQDPGFEFEKARPSVHADWFFFHGEGVFAVPEGREDSEAMFSWRDFPDDWRIASDLDHLAGARPGRVSDVVESVAIGAPDLAVTRIESEGATLRIAQRGAWRFAPETFADRVARLVDAGNRLWNDDARPFLVVLAPLGGGDEGLSIHGTGRGDAFAVASTSALTPERVQKLLAHEYLHTWFPAELGGYTDGSSGYWFSEGFTNYFTGHVMLRSGLWSEAQWLEDLNSVLARHASSPARNATAAEVEVRFWTDPDVQKLPYDRGHLLALLLDHRIRTATAGSRSLLDVLQAQRRIALEDDTDTTRLPAAERFPSVLLDETGLDIAADLASHIERGELIRLPADLPGPWAALETVNGPGELPIQRAVPR